MKRLFVLLCALAAVNESRTEVGNGGRPSGHTELIDLTRYTLEQFDGLRGNLSDSNHVSDHPATEGDLLRLFRALDDRVRRVEGDISKGDFYLIQTIWSYALVESGLSSINTYYDALRRFSDEASNGTVHPERSWTDLADAYLQGTKFGLVKLMEKLHEDLLRSDTSTVFEQTLQELGSVTCNLHESPHQIIYNLYNTVQMADYKGFVMLQFSYMILKLYGKGNFKSESERETAKFESRMKEKANAVRNAMSNADRSVYNCDPKQFVEGQTYVKLTKLLQGYIENEVNLNPYGTCRENCPYYVYTEYYGCYKDQFCGRQEPCRGKVVECKFVDSDMNICKSSDPERRYDWIEYENGNVLGNKGKCRNINFYKVDSWWRYLFWHCSYCFCLCDDASYSSDRYFNLRPVTSDTENNKVITGVRIRKHNKIIHLQIQQGVLGPRGLIDRKTLSWKPVDNYTISDKDVESGVDYHTMNWMNRILDLDEAVGLDEHVLTGVRLRTLGYHLNLEIRVTPINFTSGEILPEVHSTWISNDNTEVSLSKPRKEVTITNPDIPIRNGPHLLDSQHDQFIKFQQSSTQTDAAQSTVPFFDAQPITSQGFPLSGMGFIHRGKPGSGGFIAPKLISYNFAPHIL